MAHIAEATRSRSIAGALLVSDDAATLQQVTECMQQLAISPEVCTGISNALRLLNQKKFDAIVVDLQLGEQATAVLEQVHQSGSNRTAVTFAISDSEKETATAFKAGSKFVLERPLSLTSINRTLKAAYGMIVRERRRYFRCPITIPAALRARDGQEIQCQILNISEGGIAMSIPVPLKPGVQAMVQFKLHGQPTQFEVKSQVCWYNERGQVGLQFVSLSPAQASELGEWLSRRLEASLPESVADKFRNATTQG